MLVLNAVRRAMFIAQSENDSNEFRRNDIALA